MTCPEDSVLHSPNPRGRTCHNAPMQAAENFKRNYRFGQFQADLANGELLRQGVRVRLQDQPFRLLTILLERAGEIVSREDLRQKLWPADTYVEFDGSLNAALKRLRAALGDAADNPIFIETIPKRGYRFIAPVRNEDEQSRPQSKPERPSLLLVSPLPAVQTVPADRSDHKALRWKSLLFAGASLALLMGAIAWYAVRHRPPAVRNSTTTSPPPIPLRKAVAILGFYNASGRADDQWLATAFSEMLNTELASGEKLRLVPGEEIANLQRTAQWAQTGTLSPETCARIGSALNSDMLVSGSYTSVGKRLRLDVSLQDAKTGEVLTRIAETSGSDDLFRVTSEIGGKLRERMGVPGIEDADQAGVLASLPLDHEAARFYALGIAKLREFDALAAKDLLQQACAADPKFSLAHAMLARAWGQLGYEQKRKEEARKALDLSVDLPRTDHLQVEGDYYSSVPDFDKASSAYRALFELFPDSVEYGLQIANVQNAAGHATQALETIARLRRLPPPASQDARIDITEARIGGANVNSLALLENAESKASRQGQKLLFASARLEQCREIVYGEHPEQGTASCQDAYKTYQAAGNRLQASYALGFVADLEATLGHIAQAKAIDQQALAILEGLGENLKTGKILNNMAILYTNEGDLARGEQLYREALFHFQRAGDKGNTATALSNIGDIAYLRGNLPAAEKAYKQSIDIVASVDGGNPSYDLYRTADVELIEGHVAEAHEFATKAVEAAGDRPDRASAIAELGDVLLAEGDLAGARRQYQSALSIRQAQGRAGDAADVQASLAQEAIEEGHPEQGEALVRLALAQYEKEKQGPSAASAYTVLSRAVLMQAKIEEAREDVQRAAELIRSTPEPGLHLPLAIQAARVAAATPGARQNAAEQLRSVVESAKRQSYIQLAFEARLVLCEMEVKVNPAAGRASSLALAQEANGRKLALISRNATNLATNALATATTARSEPQR
jgi:eukaryotic-like serine/threonine-protein kinase